MFAVPGWSLSASAPKTQTDFGSRQNSNALQNGATAEVAPAKSKKRKRGGRPSSGVTGENVAELWEQHIEGKKAKKPSGSQLKRERKERKQHDGPALAEDDANGVDDGESEVMHSGTPSGVTSDTPGQHAEPESKAEKKSKKHKKDSDVHTATTPKTTIPQADKPAPPLPPATKLTPLQAAMRQKLISARFRHLNQTLYTTPSSNSLSLFAENPDMFEDYHSGFRQQVSVWPENPVDGYVRTLQERGKVRPQRGGWKDKKGKIAGDEGEQGVVALPRTEGTCTVADLGCGDASLSSQLTASKSAKKLKLNILSFDLHSPSPLVTKADIANLPLEDGSVDVAIFCLALMGTNWIEFIDEAWRVLHWKGELWVAEIKSRFGRLGGGKNQKGGVVDHSVGNKRKQAATKKALDADRKKKDEASESAALMVEVDGVVDGAAHETDVSSFVEVLCRRGFVLRDDHGVDLSNRMFVKLNFVKGLTPTKGKNIPPRKPGEDNAAETWKRKPKTKFLEDDKDVATEDEAKVLKPCVYKLR